MKKSNFFLYFVDEQEDESVTVIHRNNVMLNIPLYRFLLSELNIESFAVSLC